MPLQCCMAHSHAPLPGSFPCFSSLTSPLHPVSDSEDGEELFPRKWNEEYIDAQAMDVQRQPFTAIDNRTAIVGRAKGQYQMLYQPSFLQELLNEGV